MPYTYDVNRMVLTPFVCWFYRSAVGLSLLQTSTWDIRMAQWLERRNSNPKTHGSIPWRGRVGDSSGFYLSESTLVQTYFCLTPIRVYMGCFYCRNMGTLLGPVWMQIVRVLINMCVYAYDSVFACLSVAGRRKGAAWSVCVCVSVCVCLGMTKFFRLCHVVWMFLYTVLSMYIIFLYNASFRLHYATLVLICECRKMFLFVKRSEFV